MSDVIRAYGMKMSHNGTCRKCGEPRDKGSHAKCDRWPSIMSQRYGFHYTANSQETDLAEFLKVAGMIAVGDNPDTPVQFEIRIRQVLAHPNQRVR